MSADTPHLNDDELAELDVFLLSDACDDEVLSDILARYILLE